MALLRDISVIDTMIGFKDADSGHYVPPSVRQEDKGEQHVADYMFTGVPAAEDQVGAVQRTLDAMEANGVGMGLVALMGAHALNAVRNYPDRFLLCSHIDPTDVMEAVNTIHSEHKEQRQGQLRHAWATRAPAPRLQRRRQRQRTNPAVLQAQLPGEAADGDAALAKAAAV